MYKIRKIFLSGVEKGVGKKKYIYIYTAWYLDITLEFVVYKEREKSTVLQ